jgi:hypothetical protein
MKFLLLPAGVQRMDDGGSTPSGRTGVIRTLGRPTVAAPAATVSARVEVPTPRLLPWVSPRPHQSLSSPGGSSRARAVEWGLPRHPASRRRFLRGVVLVILGRVDREY